MADYDKIVSINYDEINNKFKEFFDLSDYYLKLSIASQEEILFQCYNTKLLDNIECREKITIKQLNEYSENLKSFHSIEDILEQIDMIIENGKYNFEKDGENICLNLMNGKDKIPICLKKNNVKQNDFHKIISNEIIEIRKQDEKIIKIRKDYKELFEKIEELKKIILNQ